MSSQKTIFPPLALGLLLILSYGVTACKVKTTNQISQTRSLTLAHTNRQTELFALLPVQLAFDPNSEGDQSLLERAIQIAQAIPNQADKIRALSAIALNLAQTGHTQHSQHLFDQALQLSKQTSPEFNFYAQGPALQDVIIKIAQAGQTKQALQLTKTLPGPFKASTLNEIAASLAHFGQLLEAKQVLLSALESARGINGDTSVSNGYCSNDKFEVLSKIAANLSLLSQLDTALVIANSIYGCGSAADQGTQDYQAWAYIGILNHLSKVNQVKQTWNSARSIRNSWEKDIAWSAIAVKLIDMGETPLALSIAKKLALTPPEKGSSSEGQSRNFQNHENGLRDIALKLAQKRQFDAAIQVAQRMSEPPQPKAGEPSELYDYFPRPSPKETTLGEIAHQMALQELIPQALQVANDIPDTEAKATSLIAIAKVLQETRRNDQASQILQELPPLPSVLTARNYRGHKLVRNVAAALVSVGQTERALQLAHSIPDQEEALRGIAVQLADTGQIERALLLSNTLKGEGSKEIVKIQVASKLMELGQLERALQIILDMSSFEKDKLLITIADQFARKGQLTQAKQAAEAINDSVTKVQAIAGIASLTW
jgi:tetratricopeptide (TPR) repeat protein